MELKNETSNIEENTTKVKESVNKLSNDLQKEFKTPEGKRNVKIIVTLGLILSIMAVVYIGLSKNMVNHTAEETKAKAIEYSAIAKEKALFKQNAENSKNINAIKTPDQN